MKPIKVYWTPISGKDYDVSEREHMKDILTIEPEPILKNIVSSRDKDVHYLQCPGFKDYFKNTFVVKSPIDLAFEVRTQEFGQRYAFTHMYDQNFFDKFVSQRFTENISKPMMSLEFASFIFYSEESVMLEQTPAFMSIHDSEVVRKTAVIPGTFNISKWIRPATFSFEVIEDAGIINIKRGDPLYYVRLIPNNGAPIKLIRTEMTSELSKVTDSCVSVKQYIKGNTLQQNYDLAHPLIQRFKDKIFPKKCPFGFKSK